MKKMRRKKPMALIYCYGFIELEGKSLESSLFSLSICSFFFFLLFTLWQKMSIWTHYIFYIQWHPILTHTYFMLANAQTNIITSSRWINKLTSWRRYRKMSSQISNTVKKSIWPLCEIRILTCQLRIRIEKKKQKIEIIRLPNWYSLCAFGFYEQTSQVICRVQVASHCVFFSISLSPNMFWVAFW